MKPLTILILVIILLLLFSGVAYAQVTGTKATPSTSPQLTKGSLEGYVMMDGKGIPAKVTVQHSTNKSLIYGTVNADEYGHYLFKALPAGVYVLNITPSGYYGGFISEQFKITGGVKSRLNVPVTAKKGTLAGNVKLENKPLGNCIVTLYNPSDLKIPLYQVSADTNGDYILDDVISADSNIKPLKVSSTYNLTIISSRLSKNWTIPGSVVVRSDKTTTANARINYQKGNISGTILTASGIPVPYAVIKLYIFNSTYTSPEIANVTTDANGTFRFKNIPATPSGKLIVWPGGWARDYKYKAIAYKSTAKDTISSKPLDVYPSNTTMVNYTFPNTSYKTGCIQGYLVTDTSYPLSNVTVSLMGKDAKGDRVLQKAITQADGSFSFDSAVASTSPVRPVGWTGDYWLKYSNSRQVPFKLKANETLVKNVTVYAQPYLVNLVPERHYVRTDDQCVLNARITDQWGNPYTGLTKIGVEIANNSSYGGRGAGAIDKNNMVTLVLTVTNGTTNITYGWANSRFAGWNVTIESYPYPRRPGTIVSNCTLSLLSPGTPYPEELPITTEPTAVPTEVPLQEPETGADDLDGDNGDESVSVEPTPTISDPIATPTPVTGTGNFIDEFWAYLKSIFNWQ